MPTTPDLTALRAALATAQQMEAQVEQQFIAARTRLPEIGPALVTALANGDATTAAALRAERAQLTTDVVDLEAAVTVAHQRTEAADRDIARVELPGLFAGLVAARDTITAAVITVKQNADTLTALRQVYLSRFVAAGYSPNHELAPANATRFPGYVARVEGLLRDLTVDGMTAGAGTS